MIEAGINPLGQNLSPIASSPVQSADLANQQPLQVAPNAIGNGINQGVSSFADKELKEAETLLTMKKSRRSGHSK